MDVDSILFALILGLLFIAEVCFVWGYFSWGENLKLEYYLEKIGITLTIIAVMLLVLLIIFL